MIHKLEIWVWNSEKSSGIDVKNQKLIFSFSSFCYFWCIFVPHSSYKAFDLQFTYKRTKVKLNKLLRKLEQ